MAGADGVFNNPSWGCCWHLWIELLMAARRKSKGCDRKGIWRWWQQEGDLEVAVGKGGGGSGRGREESIKVRVFFLVDG